jgi:hypothetical protein
VTDASVGGGCECVVAQRDDAIAIDSEALGRTKVRPTTFVAGVHMDDLACLQCVLAGEDPRAPEEPIRMRYNPFTRTDMRLTRFDVVRETWRGVVGGDWRTDAEMAHMAEEGTLQGYDVVVFVLPDGIVTALAREREPATLARRWSAVLPHTPDVRIAEAAIATLVHASHAAVERGECVFVIERL